MVVNSEKVGVEEIIGDLKRVIGKMQMADDIKNSA